MVNSDRFRTTHFIGLSVSRSRLVGSGRSWGAVLGLSLVRNLGHVSSVAVHGVRHPLYTAVGKQYKVSSLSVVSISILLVAEVVTRGIVIHCVVEVVLSWSL